MASEQAQPDREHTNQGDIILRLSHTRSRLASLRAGSPQQTPPSTPNWNGDLATLEDFLLSSQSGSHRGLGTFLGVFVPCTATTFGVVVFMRLGFVVGYAGVWLALLFVFGAFLLCLLTTLSLCALISSTDGCPNEPEPAAITPRPSGTRLAPAADPGVYSALRKRVGPELGAALGTAFFAAFTADVAFYITGFSEALCAAVGVGSHGRPDAADATQVFPWNAPGTWVETAVSSGVLVLLALVCARGVHFSAQVSALSLAAILVILLLALVCLLVPTFDAQSGLTQLSAQTFANNSWPVSMPGRASEGFSATLLFALTFPGFTGFLAGSNLSADLRTPTRSIVRPPRPQRLLTLAHLSRPPRPQRLLTPAHLSRQPRPPHPSTLSLRCAVPSARSCSSSPSTLRSCSPSPPRSGATCCRPTSTCSPRWSRARCTRRSGTPGSRARRSPPRSRTCSARRACCRPSHATRESSASF